MTCLKYHLDEVLCVLANFCQLHHCSQYKAIAELAVSIMPTAQESPGLLKHDFKNIF